MNPRIAGKKSVYCGDKILEIFLGGKSTRFAPSFHISLWLGEVLRDLFKHGESLYELTTEVQLLNSGGGQKQHYD